MSSLTATYFCKPSHASTVRRPRCSGWSRKTRSPFTSARRFFVSFGGLAYPEIREKNPHVTTEVIDAFLARIMFRGVLNRDVPHVFDFPRDPDDAAYIDLAAAVSADYLVTRDQDLLSLATDHD